MLPLILISVVLVLLAVGLLSIRLLLIKGSQFRGTCAGNSPFLNREGIQCGICGSKPGEVCKQDDKKTFTAENPR